MEQVLAQCPLDASSARVVFERDLVRFLEEVGDFEAATQVYRDTLAQRREHFPDDHPAIASSLGDLGAALIQHDRQAEAEPLLRECLKIRRTALPPDHWRIAQTMILIGESLMGQRKFAAAELLLLDGYHQVREDAHVPTGQLHDALERLVELYEAWERPDEAASWRTKLAEVGSRPS